MKIFIAYGVIILMLFFAAGTRGLVLSGMMQGAHWGSQGHGQYHK